MLVSDLPLADLCKSDLPARGRLVGVINLGFD